LTFPRDLQEIPPALSEVERVHVVDIAESGGSTADYLRSRLEQVIHLRPCLYPNDLRKEVSRLIRQFRPRVLLACGTAAFRFLEWERPHPQITYVLDEAGLDHLRDRSRLRVESSILKRVTLSLRYLRMRRYEKAMCRKADRLLAVTPSEQKYLERFARNVPTTLVPCGANLDLFPFHYAGDENQTLLFCGDLTYPPNEDAMLYFLRDIFPVIIRRCPETRFHIVGHYNGERLRQWSERFPQVRLKGYVEDLQREYRSASIFVNPVRYGRGYISKVMDAFTAGLAVVSLDFLADGIAADPGDHYMRAADSKGFADSVIHLLENPSFKERMAARARRFAETRTWDSAFQSLAEIVGNRTCLH